MSIRLVFAVALVLASSSGFATHFSPKKLSKWRLTGIGESSITQEGKFQLRESGDSLGVVLLSKRKFAKRSILRFKVKPQSYEGVLVVLIAASDKSTNGRIEIPDDYDGNWNFWKSHDSQVQSYAFAFHTGYHQPYAFLKRNPGFQPLAQQLDVATDEVWYAVEIGRDHNRLWLKIDDELQFDVEDSGDELPAGYIGFRLRGPGDGSFSALIKNVRVLEE